MKVSKCITIDSELIEKLKQEPNASQLIENLLNDHYNIILLSKQNNKSELQTEKEILTKKLDEVKEELGEKEKGELDRADKMEKLFKVTGINNPELILILEKMATYPNNITARQLRDTHKLDSTLQVYKGWRILHGDWSKDDDENEHLT